MTKSKINRLIAILFCFLICLSTIYLPVGYGYAEEPVKYPFDMTDPLDDLESSENFNLAQYMWDTEGKTSKPCIVNFVEWCYSPFKTGDYALYVYFYNPARVQVSRDSISNRIQMASAYTDENGEPTGIITRDSIPSDYDTYQLIHCGASQKTNYEGMFHKFRVVDKKTADGKTIEKRVNSTERRYDVSGIALADTRGNVKEYTVGGTYRFTGYAAGYDADENNPSTLQNSGYTALETLRLEVHPTNYRVDGVSDLGAGHQWDLTSVYFSVPEEYFTKYDNLQKVKAEWWEYKTQPIVVVNNIAVRDELLNHVGKVVEIEDTTIPYSIYTKETKGSRPAVTTYYNYIYNHDKGSHFGGARLNALYYSFYSNAVGSGVSDNILVSKKALEAYVNNYTASYVKGKLDIKSGKISADLFRDTVDSGRTRGYNCQEIDANDKINLLSWDDAGHNAWDKFWTFGFGSIETSKSFNDISPINANISPNDVALSDSNLANVLLIDKNDAGTFRTFYNTAKENGERTVIFHFAKTDYYSVNQKVYNVEREGILGDNSVCDCQLSTETVFLDFKIIHLTFKDANNKYKVIPVVSDPIDIYKDVTPALTPKIELPNWLDGLKNLGNKTAAWIILIVSIVVGVLLLWLLFVILRAINNIGNIAVKLILMLAALSVFVVIGYFGGTWVYGVINGLGGLI